MAVAQRLVNGAKTRLRHLEDELRVKLPVADVIDREYNAAPLRDVALDVVEVLDRRDAQDVGLRQGGHFEGADGIRAQRREMPEGQRVELPGGLFPAERSAEIFPCELAVAGQDHPQQNSQALTEHEAHGQRQTANHHDHAVGQPGDETVKHGQTKFPGACGEPETEE